MKNNFVMPIKIKNARKSLKRYNKLMQSDYPG